MRYKIADVIFDLDTVYDYTGFLCKNYVYNGSEPSDYSLKVTKEDIAKEKALAPTLSDGYLESLVVFRRLCEYVLNNQKGIIFHSSAVAVDNKAYLFTAPSGTGKSTHARLWRELLGDRVVMVNDDKPIIGYDNGDFYVYGTPWNGKHALDTNTRVRIEAICEIKQAKENSIEKMQPGEMLVTFLKQTLRPSDLKEMDKLLNFIETLLKTVKLYRLNCNMDISAAKLSYTTMSGEKI